MNNRLIKYNNGMITSGYIAEFIGTPHYNVLQSILDTMADLPQYVVEAEFRMVPYIIDDGTTYLEYHLTEAGLTHLLKAEYPEHLLPLVHEWTAFNAQRPQQQSYMESLEAIVTHEESNLATTTRLERIQDQVMITKSDLPESEGRKEMFIWSTDPNGPFYATEI
jgi:phage regulator Rha-like protein